ncbi:hypothetical protein A3J91_05030 [Candidatus Peribacteria bacterium RIFOXYC2_FULL_58_10]|nr:MAG: hypothetical protein A3J91_05030 [Candidatus Peribacteria bacterium RIFOXYC2_FULL_58_10]OGJ84065.1 MAG: hypothetical protein A2529_04715 [Candidatus Peribacteria bacterium RIFOXYD2_FULL_58_15]HAS34085.1 hypothetical protein [Candidatus Peribacteria bacterium]
MCTKEDLSTISSIATIIGILIGIPTLILSYQQLKDLNAKSAIEIQMESPETIALERDKPFDVYFKAKNHGDFISSAWVAAISFCQNTEIVQADPLWKTADGKFFTLESQKSIVPNLLIYAPEVNKIGAFKIALENLQRPIPIALVFTSGERMDSTPSLISLSDSGSFINEKFEVNDGKVISDSHGCFRQRGQAE